MVWERDVHAALGDDASALEEALARAGLRRLPVRLGVCDGMYVLRDGDVVLSRQMFGGDTRLPFQGSKFVPPVPLSRQAVGCVAAGHFLQALTEHVGRYLPLDWVSAGWSMDRSAALFPDWGLCDGWVAEAYLSGMVGSVPSRGVLVMQAWRQLGVDVDRRVIEILRDGMYPSSTEWLQIVERILDIEQGPVGALGVVLPAMPQACPPVAMSAWSWARVGPGPKPHGGRLVSTDGVAIAKPWLSARDDVASLVAAAGRSGSVHCASGGPVATWDLVGVETQAEVVGARGVHLRVDTDNRFGLEAREAVVGPCAALAHASYGTVRAEGTWHVVGSRTVRLVPDLAEDDPILEILTCVHPALQKLISEPWEWLIRGERMFARLDVTPGNVAELRWRRLTNSPLSDRS